MSKLFDGSDEPLSYGQALVEVAERAAWQSEAHCKEVVNAIRKEHGLELPEPDHTANPADPRDLTIRAQDELLEKAKRRIETLNAELEAAELEKKVKAARAGAESS